MDLTTMRIQVRRDLKDEDEYNYRWSDDEIDRAIMRALEEFSLYCPLEMTTELATVPESDEVDISSLNRRINVIKVEFPLNNRPRSFIRFSVFNDKLFLSGTAGNGDNCLIYWSCLHTLDGGISTIPPRYEGLIALGAGAYAVFSESQFSTDKAPYGGGNVDTDYLRWANGRIRDFRRGCRRAAAVLRTGQLYC